MEDITERRRAEDALQRYAERMQTLHAIDRAILAARSPEAVAAAALDRIRRLVPCQCAGVAEFDLPAGQAIILATNLDGATEFAADPRVPLDALGGLAELKQGRPYAIDDLLSSPTPYADPLLPKGTRSVLVMPLVANDELIGSLSLGASAPGAFSTEHREITREVADQLAIAIQHARLLDQTTEALAREQRLNEIARTISESLDLQVLIPNIVRLTAELVRAESGGLAVLTEDGQTLTLPYTFNYPAGMSREPIGRERGGLAWHIAETGAPLLLDDYLAHTQAQQDEAVLSAYLGVPVVASGAILGTLFVFHTSRGKRFSTRDQALVESIGWQAGTAIQNARLFAAEQRRVALLTALYDIGLDLSAQLDLVTPLQTLVERTVYLLDATIGGLYLLQPDGQTLELVACSPRDYIGKQLQLGEGVAGQIAQSGVPVLMANYREWTERPAIYANAPFGAVAGVPVTRQGQVLGVLEIVDEWPDRFGADAIETLRLLAAQAAVAIHNTQLYHAAQDAIQRKDEALALLDTLLASAPIGMAFHDRELRFVRINETLAAINGLAPEAHLGRTVREILPTLASSIEPLLRRVLTTGEPIAQLEVAAETPKKPGLLREWLASYYPVPGRAGQTLGVGVVIMDITERKRLESQLLQAQKMESIGQLAGGIAHDFNNLLTAITGYAELARDTLAPDHPVRHDLSEILTAAGRARNLTRQLLAFARKQIIAPQVINLNNLMLDIDKLLRRLIGEDIELVALPDPNLGSVKVDAGQIEQVLLNLAVNARQAMPGGGKLTIATRNVALDPDAARHYVGLMPGAYVALTISDTGVGIDQETRKHIFEPFFTTKDPSEGSGLGLAMCYGIVNQHGGNISVESTVGRGTIFQILLPRVEAAAAGVALRDDRSLLPRGNEGVLVAEDEPAVRALAVRILRQQGYRVLEATNGEEALRVARERPDESIALLLTDLVMPQMGGATLAEQIALLYPSIKVLFMSGYSDTAVIQSGPAHGGVAFLHKPFSPAALAGKVREVLDS